MWNICCRWRWGRWTSWWGGGRFTGLNLKENAQDLVVVQLRSPSQVLRMVYLLGRWSSCRHVGVSLWGSQQYPCHWVTNTPSYRLVLIIITGGQMFYTSSALIWSSHHKYMYCFLCKPRIKQEPGAVLYPGSTKKGSWCFKFPLFNYMTWSLLFGKKGPSGSRSLFP